VAELLFRLQQATRQGRNAHYLPPYRGDTVLRLAHALGQSNAQVRQGMSAGLTDAEVALREIKGDEEVVGLMEGIVRRCGW
jgi:hypothetical protein